MRFYYIPYGNVNVGPRRVFEVQTDRVDQLDDSRKADATIAVSKALQLRNGEKFTYKRPMMNTTVVSIFRLFVILSFHITGMGIT